MSADETKVWATKNVGGLVEVKAKSTVGLDLGEIRKFIAAADAVGLPDKTNVYVMGLSASATWLDRYWTKRIIAEHTFNRVDVEVAE